MAENLALKKLKGSKKAAHSAERTASKLASQTLKDALMATSKAGCWAERKDSMRSKAIRWDLSSAGMTAGMMVQYWY